MLVFRQATTLRPLPFATAGAAAEPEPEPAADPEPEPEPAAEPEPEPAAEPEPEPATVLPLVMESAQYFSTSALQLAISLATAGSPFGVTAAAEPEPEPGLAVFAAAAGAAGAGVVAAGADGAGAGAGAEVWAIAIPETPIRSAPVAPAKALANRGMDVSIVMASLSGDGSPQRDASNLQSAFIRFYDLR